MDDDDDHLDFLFEDSDVIDVDQDALHHLSQVTRGGSYLTPQTNRGVPNSLLPEQLHLEPSPHPQLSHDAPEIKIPPQCRPVLHNILASCNLNCDLDLRKINYRTKNCEFNPKRFNALTMRIKNPIKATCNMFANGRIVIVGTRSEHDARYAARLFTKIIEKTGHSVHFSNFKIQNILASANFGFPIRIDALKNDIGNEAYYEVESFAGTIIRLTKPKATFMIFASGKVIISGVESREAIREGMELLYPRCLKFMKSSHKEQVLMDIQSSYEKEVQETQSLISHGESRDDAIDLDDD